MNRLILAFVLAPMSVPMAWAAIMLIGGVFPEGWKSISLFLAWVFSYLGAVAIGLPSILLLNKAGRLNLINLSIAGMFGGAVIFHLFGWLLAIGLDSYSPFDWLVGLWGGVQGAMVAFLLGIIAGIPLITPNKAPKPTQ